MRCAQVSEMKRNHRVDKQETANNKSKHRFSIAFSVCKGKHSLKEKHLKLKLWMGGPWVARGAESALHGERTVRDTSAIKPTRIDS